MSHPDPPEADPAEAGPIGGVGGPLEQRLRARRACGRKLLVPYVTGGITAEWTELLRAMVAAGADAVEVGIPFSDPVMDGPTIQEAPHGSGAGNDAGLDLR
ncbi:MAG: tryptophan synthase subunit alpha [Acidimicrobiales bacterium]